MARSRPTVLYLHGFASSPDSYKGSHFDAQLSALGHRVERLDLRLPNRDQLRVTTMIAHTVERARAHAAVTLIGSSLGGLVAAHVAARVPTVCGAVLMAPAFGFASRWAHTLGEAAFDRWRAGERLSVEDHAGGPELQIDFGFYQDASQLDASVPRPNCPLLVFHGRNDEVVDIDGSRTFVEGACDARLVELDDGHTLVDSLDTMLVEAVSFLEHVWRSNP